MANKRARRYTRSVSRLQIENKRPTRRKRKVATTKVTNDEDEDSAHNIVDEATKRRRRRHLSAPSSRKLPAPTVDDKEKTQKLKELSQFTLKRQPSAHSMADSWNYDDDDWNRGPQRWPGQIDGKQQSPIDLRLSKMKVITLKDPLQFINYDKLLNGEFVNTGHSIQFIPDLSNTESPQIRGGMLNQPYKFVQYHFHWAQDDNEGSEHALCGLRYPAELHLVHQGVEDPSKLAVLGIFLNLGSKDTALHPDSKVLPKIVECGQKVRTTLPVSLEVKLPECRDSFARYNGSLTTPPCSENVIWTIFTEPVEITHQQLKLIRSIKDYRGSIIRKNYRPLQSVNDRSVYLASC